MLCDCVTEVAAVSSLLAVSGFSDGFRCRASSIKLLKSHGALDTGVFKLREKSEMWHEHCLQAWCLS